jgi:hypothetical protein
MLWGTLKGSKGATMTHKQWKKLQRLRLLAIWSWLQYRYGK